MDFCFSYTETHTLKRSRIFSFDVCKLKIVNVLLEAKLHSNKASFYSFEANIVLFFGRLPKKHKNPIVTRTFGFSNSWWSF